VKPSLGACLFVALAAALLAQPPFDPTELLAKARDRIVARAKRLPDYVCVQTVDREYFNRRQGQHPPHSCALIFALNRNHPQDLPLRSTDRLRLELKVSQGMEIGTWAGASQFSSRSVFELIGGGAYGTGALGTFLGDIFETGRATYSFIGQGMAGAIKLATYGYRVPAESSHYQVKTGSGWTPIAFQGAFWIDSDSLDLRRLTVDANEMPPKAGVCEAVTTVEYRNVRVGTGEFLLPVRSSMRMVNADATETQTTAVYSGCREYVGESTIHFDQAPTGGEAQAAAPPPAPLPAGVSLALALTAPIDTDTAAAGDIVTAKVLRPAWNRSLKEILAPAGAVVQGRIVAMQHWLNWPRHFTIAIRLDKLEARGVARPLYARCPAAAGQAPLTAYFTFGTKENRYVVPAGFQMNWITVAPPADEKK